MPRFLADIGGRIAVLGGPIVGRQNATNNLRWSLMLRRSVTNSPRFVPSTPPLSRSLSVPLCSPTSRGFIPQDFKSGWCSRARVKARTAERPGFEHPSPSETMNNPPDALLEGFRASATSRYLWGEPLSKGHANSQLTLVSLTCLAVAGYTWVLYDWLISLGQEVSFSPKIYGVCPNRSNPAPDSTRSTRLILYG